MRKYTKEEAISIVVQCAEKYRDELDGKTLLFICTNKHKQTSAIEFSFYGNNYMHLTGLKPDKIQNGDNDEGIATSLSANDFYQRCLEHKLSPLDFSFAEDGTTHMKLELLPGMICKNLHASMIGDYNSSKPRLYTEKIVGGTAACMGFVFDKKLLEYVPNTVIREDIRDLASDSLRVIAVFRRCSNNEQYEELTYKARKVEWAKIKLPEDFSYLSGLVSPAASENM